MPAFEVFLTGHVTTTTEYTLRLTVPALDERQARVRAQMIAKQVPTEGPDCPKLWLRAGSEDEPDGMHEFVRVDSVVILGSVPDRLEIVPVAQEAAA